MSSRMHSAASRQVVIQGFGEVAHSFARFFFSVFLAVLALLVRYAHGTSGQNCGS
jgi:glutamate dehydrogenase/leucine dehydrogenase